MCALNEDVCEAVCLSSQRKDTWVQTVTYTVTLLKSHGNTLQRMNTCFHENNVINSSCCEEISPRLLWDKLEGRLITEALLCCRCEVSHSDYGDEASLMCGITVSGCCVLHTVGRYMWRLETTQEDCVRTKSLCVDSPLVPATVRLVSLAAERMCLHCSF